VNRQPQEGAEVLSFPIRDLSADPTNLTTVDADGNLLTSSDSLPLGIHKFYETVNGSYTITKQEVNGIIVHADQSSDGTITIPPSVRPEQLGFPVGGTVEIVNNTDKVVTISASPGVSLYYTKADGNSYTLGGGPGKGVEFSGNLRSVRLVKRALDTWWLIGVIDRESAEVVEPPAPTPATLVLDLAKATGARTLTFLLGSGANISVDWGDGTAPQTYTGTSAAKTYTATSGIVTVKVSGTTALFTVASNGMLTEVLSFGEGLVTPRFNLRFNGNLTTVPDSLPSHITSIEGMFEGCTKFNSPIGNWDVSRMTTMNRTFSGCASFNADISKWNTAACTNMQGMFTGCKVFNQDLSLWDTSRVKTMAVMFQSCTAFNGSLLNWNTAACENMSGMFAGCTAFNQDLSSWNTGRVTTMAAMFRDCSKFNSNMPWNVSAVTTMEGMFENCTSLTTGSLSNWQTGSCNDMSRMFAGCTKFDADLSRWDVFSVFYMGEMFFGCEQFNNGNQSLNGWQTDAANYTGAMFCGCTRFNAPVGDWQVYNSQEMRDMFAGCTSFNQDLSAWEPSVCGDMSGFLDGATAFSTANWDKLLVAWNGLKEEFASADLQISCPAKTSTAGGGAAAKAELIDYGWTIIDGGNV